MRRALIACRTHRIRSSRYVPPPGNEPLRLPNLLTLPSLSPLSQYLQAFKTMARGEGIDMELMMSSAGGTRYGTIAKTAFASQLTSYFKRFTFSEQLLFSLCHAYGTGSEDIFNGGFELVAWRDFVEDVEKAYPDKDNAWEEPTVGHL